MSRWRVTSHKEILQQFSSLVRRLRSEEALFNLSEKEF